MARLLAGMYGRVTRRTDARISRLQSFGLKVAAVTIRAAAFVMCPGDDIAAAALPVAHAWTGGEDHGHAAHEAVLPRRPVVVARLAPEPAPGGPDPEPGEPPGLPVPPDDPGAYDLGTLYQRFVLEGVATPRAGPAGEHPEVARDNRAGRSGPEAAR